MSVKPGDKILYCPSGNWAQGNTLKGVVTEILGPEDGHRAGCIKIALSDPVPSHRYSRIVRSDKVSKRDEKP